MDGGMENENTESVQDKLNKVRGKDFEQVAEDFERELHKMHKQEKKHRQDCQYCRTGK